MSLFGCSTGPDKKAIAQDTSTVARLRSSIAAFPDSAALRIRLLDAYESGRDIPSAMQLLDSLFAQDSTVAYLHYRKARLWLSDHDTTRAISSLKRAMAYAPDNTDILLELGYVLSDRGDAEARTIAETIINVSKDPDTRSRGRLLKGIYYSNKGDKASALKEYDASIVDNYTFMDAFIEKAIVLYEMKKYDDALSTLDKAQAIRPADAEVYLWKGKCQQASGYRAEAMDDYRKCLGLDPGMKEASELLAILEASK